MLCLWLSKEVCCQQQELPLENYVISKLKTWLKDVSSVSSLVFTFFYSSAVIILIQIDQQIANAS